MRRLLLYSLSVMMALLPGSISAQNAQGTIALSLEDAMEYAVNNNAKAKNAQLDFLIQKAKNAEISGITLPQIKGKGDFNDYIDPIKSFVPGAFIGQPGTFVAVPFTPKFSTAASMTASQILFDGSVLVALQARNAILKLSEQNIQLTKEELRYNVQRAYFSFVVALKQYEILKDALKFFRVIAYEQKVYQETGFVEKIEVDRTKVQLNNLVTDSIRIGSLINVSDQLLKYQMGMDIYQPIILTDTVVKDEIAEATQLLPSEIDYSNRTEFNLLESQLLLNKYDLKRHRLSGLPTLAAFGTAAYTYSSDRFKDLFHEQYIFYSLIGLQLNVPIFDGLQRRNRVKQAEFSIQKTENNIQDLKLGIDLQIAQSKTTLKNSLLALKNQEDNLSLANSVLDLARIKYKEGVGSNIEVTQAQTELLNTQTNYFQSLLELINAQTDLQKALGQFK